MNPQAQEAVRHDHRCDTCRTNFDCKTLSTALKVLDAHREEIASPELKMRYEAIVKLLDESGWAYPDGGSPCRFANLPREVQALTSELVRMWQMSHFRPRNGDDDAIYQEEVRCD